MKSEAADATSKKRKQEEAKKNQKKMDLEVREDEVFFGSILRFDDTNEEA